MNSPMVVTTNALWTTETDCPRRTDLGSRDARMRTVGGGDAGPQKAGCARTQQLLLSSPPLGTLLWQGQRSRTATLTWGWWLAHQPGLPSLQGAARLSLIQRLIASEQKRWGLDSQRAVTSCLPHSGASAGRVRPAAGAVKPRFEASTLLTYSAGEVMSQTKKTSRPPIPRLSWE